MKTKLADRPADQRRASEIARISTLLDSIDNGPRQPERRLTPS